MRLSNPGVLMCSGGIDSTVLAYVLKERGLLKALWSADYGQASAKHQAAIVEYHAGVLGVPFHIERVAWPTALRGNGFIFTEGKYPEPMKDPYAPVDMTNEEYATYMDKQFDFLEGRNIVFCTLAGGWTISQGLDTLYAAFQFDGPEWEAGGPEGPMGCDTSVPFVRLFNELVASGGYSKPLALVAPFLEQRWDKARVVAEGRILNVDLTSTYSCEFFPDCGSCHQCLIREKTLNSG